MSAAALMNQCPACGAEESLDTLLMRMIDDDQVRRLIADVLTQSLPLGGLVVRYLRLHKPPKQKLRMERVGTLLAELVPDMRRGAVTRKGREWHAPIDTWKAAFQAVFDGVEKGTVVTPLPGNAYLYEVILRMADRHERDQETQREADRRDRRTPGVRDPGSTSIGQAVASMDLAVAGAMTAMENVLARQQPSAPTAPPVPTGPSRRALELQAQIAAARPRGGVQSQGTDGE